jgi:hypothetical protein
VKMKLMKNTKKLKEVLVDQEVEDTKGKYQ